MSIYIAYYGIITVLYVLLVNVMFNVKIAVIKGQSKAEQIKRQKNLFLIIASGILILILGFRSEYQGLDLSGYFYYYHKINEDSFGEIIQRFCDPQYKYLGNKKYANFEIGFVLMCKLSGTLCSNPQIVLVICAILAIVPVVCFIAKYSNNVWLSLVIYMALPSFATMNFSAIRQGIAVGLVVWAIGYIRDKKLISFIVTILFACTFHSTAVVALACYPIYHVRLERKSALFGGIGLLAFVYLAKEFLFGILALIVHNNPQISRTNAINLFFGLAVIYILCVLLCKEKDCETRGYINIFLLACVTQLFGRVHNLAGRITWYFMPVLIVIIPNLLQNINIKEKHIFKLMQWIIGVLAILLGLYYLKNNTMALANPYVPFWLQQG